MGVLLGIRQLLVRAVASSGSVGWECDGMVIVVVLVDLDGGSWGLLLGLY